MLAFIKNQFIIVISRVKTYINNLQVIHFKNETNMGEK